jgi:hypothetical protein
LPKRGSSFGTKDSEPQRRKDAKPPRDTIEGRYAANEKLGALAVFFFVMPRLVPGIQVFEQKIHGWPGQARP